jgi:hypothetical protein
MWGLKASLRWFGSRPRVPEGIGGRCGHRPSMVFGIHDGQRAHSTRRVTLPRHIPEPRYRATSSRDVALGLTLGLTAVESSPSP